ncbi:MAG: hypothetical protein GXP62_13555, partial [Oligoflexia bacterium]|nr:hypothetical protein [Oligoflexia bacterium]
IDALVSRAHAQRRTARLLLDRVDALYKSFGLGELSQAELLDALAELEKAGPKE